MSAKLLTPQQVADMLSISKGTVYEMIKRSELNGYKVGNKLRISIEDVEDYKQKNRRGGDEVEISLNRMISNPIDLGYRVNVNTNIGDRIVICGLDPILDTLAVHVNIHPQGCKVLRAYDGGYNGLGSLYKGEVHMVAVNIWDQQRNEYNIEYVKSMLPGMSAAIINICYRMEGFYVKKGNPKNIISWADFARDDVSIVNRAKGTGTRILIDEHLKKLGIRPEEVKGYDNEASTLMGIINNVLDETADVGVGREGLFNCGDILEFIPMQKERYDLVMEESNLNAYPFKAVIETLQSAEFKTEMQYLDGYDFSDSGKIIYIT